MSRYVLDASVVVKWYVPEIHSEHALRLRGRSHDLVAPEFLLIELANTLLKKVRRAEFADDQVMSALASAADLLTFDSMTGLFTRTVEMARQFARSIYDALYVVLALEQRCPLITADRRLYDAIRPIFPATMVWVEDIN